MISSRLLQRRIPYHTCTEYIYSSNIIPESTLPYLTWIYYKTPPMSWGLFCRHLFDVIHIRSEMEHKRATLTHLVPSPGTSLSNFFITWRMHAIPIIDYFGPTIMNDILPNVMRYFPHCFICVDDADHYGSHMAAILDIKRHNVLALDAPRPAAFSYATAPPTHVAPAPAEAENYDSDYNKK